MITALCKFIRILGGSQTRAEFGTSGYSIWELRRVSVCRRNFSSGVSGYVRIGRSKTSMCAQMLPRSDVHTVMELIKVNVRTM